MSVLYEDDDDAIAIVVVFGCPASIDEGSRGFEELAYVCINDDDDEIEEGPKVVLVKLLSELSASVFLEIEVR